MCSKFRKVLKGLYHDHQVQIRLGGNLYKGFMVNSGIKQGCPASGSLFALLMDPFLRYLLCKIPRAKGIFLAFADDLAAVLFAIQTLKDVLLCFKILRLAANLRLHMKKT